MVKAVVIGSGIGGLAIAIRLARTGMKVDVYEASSSPGGKISEFRKDGFRFDTGPSLFTLPRLINDLLDKNFQPGLKKLSLITRYFWEDGTVLNAYSDPVKFAGEVEKLTSDKSNSVLKYLGQTRYLYQLTAPVFIFSTIHKLKYIFRRQNFPALLNLHRLRAMSSLHEVNRKAFSDPRIVQLFDRYATYNGSNPYKAPGTLSVISHLEHNLGAYIPEKGIYSIVDALYRQASALGVQFHFNCRVDRVMVNKGSVKGIITGGKEVLSDYVISDTDIYHFYSELLPDREKSGIIGKTDRSSSALIFYWAMEKEFKQLDVHNVFFSLNYKAEFDDIFDKKTIPDDPTIYLYISSKLIREDAPGGCENWFVMVNAPENTGQDWEKMAGKVKRSILNRFERVLGEPVGKFILFENVLDPVKIEILTGSSKGSLYGSSSNSRFAAFRRHPNFSGKFRGLYFTGGSVHPGGGIPLCLASAKIVAELIERY